MKISLSVNVQILGSSFILNIDSLQVGLIKIFTKILLKNYTDMAKKYSTNINLNSI